MQSPEHIPKSLTHDVSCPSHPFTGWTSLVTLSEDGPAMKSNQVITDYEIAVLSEKY